MSFAANLFSVYINTATVMTETLLLVIKLHISFILKIADLIIGNGSNNATTPMLDDFGALLPLLYNACEAIVILVALALYVCVFLALWLTLTAPPKSLFSCKNQ